MELAEVVDGEVDAEVDEELDVDVELLLVVVGLEEVLDAVDEVTVDGAALLYPQIGAVHATPALAGATLLFEDFCKRSMLHSLRNYLRLRFKKVSGTGSEKGFIGRSRTKPPEFHCKTYHNVFHQSVDLQETPVRSRNYYWSLGHCRPG
ncbi:MAG: hypothetical protein Q9216_003727 [Gyalolechia sp. 2 TL-2023]